MKLVIAEKASVANSIAAVLGAGTRKKGYLEGGGFLVSWCVGHLIRLADAAAYGEQYKNWQLETLPILPVKWSYRVADGKEKQFQVLKELMNRMDVEGVINACDAGREGELIFRLVYEQAGCKKPVERLWISSMEDSAIREGLSHLRPAAEYDRLYEAALCRSRADWLVGMNATRLFSCLYHRTLNIGRVMTPTLALLVKREADIYTFKPAAFYRVILTLSGMTVKGKTIQDRAQAKELEAACRTADCVYVETIEKKEREERPPALYDLTTLQREANRFLGFTAQQTLDYLQALYEKRLCTYPRTDSRFLTSDMAKDLPDLVQTAAAAIQISKEVLLFCNAAQVVCDRKVSDHHALLPTMDLQKADLGALPGGERALLRLLIVRLLCAVGQPYQYAETTVSVKCAGHIFQAKKKEIIQPGWRESEGSFWGQPKGKEKPVREDNKAPVLSEGQTCSVIAVEVKEGETTPPLHFTEDTLLAAMETAGDMPCDAERKGLGTPATRAGILEKLIRSGFAERRQKEGRTYLLPTKKGLALAGMLPETIQSPAMTAEWEHQLKKIEHGTAAPELFMRQIEAMLKELIQTYRLTQTDMSLFPNDRETVGTCPRCGSPVVEIKKGFVCEKRSCGFALWKGNRFFTAKKKELTKELAAALLKDGKAKLLGCYSEKTGKLYDAIVVLNDDGGQYVNLMLEFEGGKGK